MEIVCYDGVTRALVVQEVGHGNIDAECRVCGASGVWCGQWYTAWEGDRRRFGGMVCEPCGSVRKV